MSISNTELSLQKPSGRPPSLPATDKYGNLLPQLLTVPCKCRAGTGVSWVSKAFSIFQQNYLLWIGIGVSFFIITGLGGMIPYIGFLVSFLGIVLAGGVIRGCAAQTQGDELRFDHLFSGFQTHFAPLIKLALLYIAGIAIAVISMIAILSAAALFSDASGAELSYTSVLLILFAMLAALAVMIPLMMSIWFAPALIVLHNIEPLAAMKMSFKAGLANIMPMTVFGLVLLVIIPLFVMVTLGFGLLVVMPVMMITYYTSYRDVWTDQPLSAV